MDISYIDLYFAGFPRLTSFATRHQMTDVTHWASHQRAHSKDLLIRRRCFIPISASALLDLFFTCGVGSNNAFLKAASSLGVYDRTWPGQFLRSPNLSSTALNSGVNTATISGTEKALPAAFTAFPGGSSLITEAGIPCTISLKVKQLYPELQSDPVAPIWVSFCLL